MNEVRHCLEAVGVIFDSWRIVHVRVSVDAASKSDRITLDIPSGRRVIVSEDVVVRSARRTSSYPPAISPVHSRT